MVPSVGQVLVLYPNLDSHSEVVVVYEVDHHYTGDRRWGRFQCRGLVNSRHYGVAQDPGGEWSMKWHYPTPAPGWPDTNRPDELMLLTRLRTLLAGPYSGDQVVSNLSAAIERIVRAFESLPQQ